MVNDKTRIQVTKKTLKRLKEVAKKSETYDEFINRVVDEVKK